jgi:hypothetical protein
MNAEVVLSRAIRSPGWRCVYRKLNHGHNGDEVHPGWRVN